MWIAKLCAAFWLVVSTGAQAPVAKAAVAAPVMIAVDEYNPPYMYKEDGKAKGIYPEVMRAIFKQLNIDLAIESLPWNRAVERAALGDWGVSYGPAFDEAARKHQFKVEENVSDLLNFAKLRRGRIDCVVAVDIAGLKIIGDRHCTGSVKMHETPVSTNLTYLMLPKSRQAIELLKQFNTVLAAMKADHRLAQLFEKNAQ